MSESNVDKVTCSNCGAEIDLGLDLPDYRTPCASCGDTKRTVIASIKASVVVRGGLEMKGKRPGQKKPFVEDKGVPSYSRNLKKIVHHERLIDRDNDLYRERVTDYESGDTIHHCEEPLSEHQGHGSAKFKSKKNG